MFFVCKCVTRCVECGFVDYWAYGFYESKQMGLMAHKNIKTKKTGE